MGIIVHREVVRIKEDMKVPISTFIRYSINDVFYLFLREKQLRYSWMPAR